MSMCWPLRFLVKCHSGCALITEAYGALLKVCGTGAHMYTHCTYGYGGIFKGNQECVYSQL